LSLLLESHRTAIVAAHPDDETAGAGACLSRLPQTFFIHVTDGAPRDMREAAAIGFSSREEYAAARRQEFQEALQVGDIRPAESVALDYADQEASLHLVSITRDLLRLLAQFAVDTVLVHPYEGGHPDHDATAFAVHSACRLLTPEHRPRIVEFTSYHSRNGEMETGVFLADNASPEIILKLDSVERSRKERMLACYRTQHAVLQHFRTTEERFRQAPAYDFTRPPHAGLLFYEQFPWGMTGSHWLTLAQSALGILGLA
jgi:N-acetylglucosamine malate deacetylase 2